MNNWSQQQPLSSGGFQIPADEPGPGDVERAPNPAAGSVALSRVRLLWTRLGIFPSRVACVVMLAATLQCGPTQDAAQTVPAPAAGQAEVETSSPIVPEKILPYSLAVAAQGDRVYLSRGRELLAFETGADQQPRLRGRLSLEGEVRDIAAQGDLVFVAVLGSGLEIVDGSDPSRLQRAGWLKLPLAEGVHVEPGRAYVAARKNGLAVIDVTNPAQPAELGRYQTQEGALKVTVAGRLAYVAASYAGMRVLDIDDPAHISEVGFATRGSYGQGASWGVAVDGDRAYSAIPDNGLRQVDVSDPSKADTLSIFRSLYAPIAVAVREKHAFVADQHDGLVVLDRTEDFMREVARLGFDDSVTDVALSGPLAFLALKSAGLAVVDVRNPLRPRQVARIKIDE